MDISFFKVKNKMNYKNFELPDDLLYNKDSSWVKVDGDIATVGIIEPSAKIVKEFLFIKLPELKHLDQGDNYLSLEAMKWSGHLSSPVTGEIIKIHDKLYDEPETINQHPYKQWIIKVKLTDKTCLKNLFKPEDIVDWLDKTLKL